MGEITELANHVYRNGPSGNPNYPVKSEIRDLFAKVDDDKTARYLVREESGAVPVDLITYLMSSGPVMPTIWDAVAHVVGETAVDQTAKVQAMMDGLHAARTPDALFTRPYYINGTVTIPEDCGIVGISQGGEETDKASNAGKRPGVLVLGPLGKIICSNKTRIRRMSIISLDAMTQPTTLAEAVSRITAWSGTAITIASASSDVDISDNYIVGFDTAIHASEAERHTICRNKIDCHNGIRSHWSWDVPRAHDNHIWPFWATHMTFPDNHPTLAATQAYTRRGAGIWSDGANDGWLITNNLIFGFRDGILIQGNYANKVRGNWLDNSLAAWGSEVTAGIRVNGAVRLLTITDNHVDQHTYGMVLDHSYGESGRQGILVTSNTFGSCGHRWIWCGSGDGVIDGVMAGGNCGNYGIELAPGCGHWTLDNIHAVDAANVEAGSGPVSLIYYSGADLPKIKVGAVTAYGNVVHNYRAFGTDVVANRNTDQSIPANTEAIVGINNKNFDSLGEFDTATSEFTSFVEGRYIISGCVAFESPTADKAVYGLYLYTKDPGGSWKKGRLFAQGYIESPGLIAMPFSDSLHMAEGTSFRLAFLSSQAETIKGGPDLTYLRVYRLPTSRA